jgi:predicted phosphodiesterase
MRIAIVSDIHSNLPALQAVLADMGEADAIWCLGDFVGYGPWPNECIALLREARVTAISGNHDLAAIGQITTEAFNRDAAIATAWTTSQLSPESVSYLASLPPMGEVDGVTLAHGTPREPVWEYLLSDEGARASFERFTTQLCLVGHTHIPSVFVEEPDGRVTLGHMPGGTIYKIGEKRTIANPGSVGQPRDQDPRSAYLLYDTTTGTLEWKRVAYEIPATQVKMREVGLPPFFISRLERGV